MTPFNMFPCLVRQIGSPVTLLDQSWDPQLMILSPNSGTSVKPFAVCLQHMTKFSDKIDGPYLVTSCRLLSSTTQICKVENYTCSQIYSEKPTSIFESFGANFEVLYFIKVHCRRSCRVLPPLTSPS